ncbi:MAG: hypothetical protein C4293_20990, partial [Nitrospiraceae bacterium]
IPDMEAKSRPINSGIHPTRTIARIMRPLIVRTVYHPSPECAYSNETKGHSPGHESTGKGGNGQNRRKYTDQGIVTFANSATANATNMVTETQYLVSVIFL